MGAGGSQMGSVYQTAMTPRAGAAPAAPGAKPAMTAQGATGPGGGAGKGMLQQAPGPGTSMNARPQQMWKPPGASVAPTSMSTMAQTPNFVNARQGALQGANAPPQKGM